MRTVQPQVPRRRPGGAVQCGASAPGVTPTGVGRSHLGKWLLALRKPHFIPARTAAGPRTAFPSRSKMLGVDPY